MFEVACEIIATYNAMIIANNNNEEADFCRLAVEFETNAIKDTGILTRGKFGSEPKRIYDCLNAYAVKFDYYDEAELDKMEDEIKNSSNIAIYSYNFASFDVWWIIKDYIKMRIHTCFCFFDIRSNSIISLNRGSGSMNSSDKESIKESIGDDRDFRCGYIISKD